MKMLKVWTMALLMGLLVLSGASLGQAAEDETMANAQFASILVDVLGLKMPWNAARLTDEKLFEVQANMLAERGIMLFVDAKPDAQVTRGAVADVLYGAIIGPSTVTTDVKIDYLVSLGYISSGGADEVMSSSEVIATLNVPVLSRAVAEAYSPPGAAGVGFVGPGRGIIPPAMANPAPEGPASPI